MRWFPFVIAMLLVGCDGFHRGEKEKDVPIGYEGKARMNPYLAAELFLKKKDWEVKSSRIWSNYSYETNVIFMPVSFLGTRGMGIRVLDWVAEGGMLVLTVEGGEPERNDFKAYSAGGGLPEEGKFSGMDYVFEELGVELVAADWSEFSEGALEVDGHLSRSWHMTKFGEEMRLGSLHLEQEGEIGLRVEDGSVWDFEVEGVSRVIGVGYGDGEVMVMAHARPLRSPYLARADHGQFLEMIAENYGEGDIVFLYGSGTSFFELLWKEGRMVVIAGVFLLVFWLWKRIPRFGPLLEDLDQKPKPYGESLKASAMFLWRRGQIEHYLRPLRARIEQGNEGDPETLYDRLSESSELPRSEVVEALAINPPKDPGHILKVARKLQTLLKR